MALLPVPFYGTAVLRLVLNEGRKRDARGASWENSG